MSAPEDIFDTIRSLWAVDPSHPVASILPRDPDSLSGFYPRLRALVDAAPRSIQGRVDPQAIVQGDIVSLGKGSVIEAGAIVHSSCRLMAGEDCIIRAGAVLRDEVVMGDRCLVGVNCEVVRSVLLGPDTHLGHFVFVGDSVLGRDTLLSGNVWVANTTARRGGRIHLYFRGQKIDSGRSHLGVLLGDGARIAASTTICSGCIVLPQLSLPPSVTLHGTIDGARRHHLLSEFRRMWVEPRPG